MLFKWFSRILHTVVFLAFLYIFINLFAPMMAEASPITNIFINEIHYDNIGGDLDEYVEIAGDASIDLTGWSLRLYNGSNGKEYSSFNFDSWSYIDINTQFGFHSIKTTGIQNGSPDGLALFDGIDVIQFLSYEGSFTATSGIAKDLLSTDIGVNEATNTPLGFSLQLTGKGRQYEDFTWSSPQKNSFGSVNVGQEFAKANLAVTPLAVTSVSEPSSLLLFFMFIIFVILSKYKSILIFDPSTLRPFDPSTLRQAQGERITSEI